jgi:hypothetical protein
MVTSIIYQDPKLLEFLIIGFGIRAVKVLVKPLAAGLALKNPPKKTHPKNPKKPT